MAEASSLFSQVLNTYRDVEVAKRNQPKLIQGIQQVQTPLASNYFNPPIVGSAAGGSSPVSNNLPVILGVLGLSGLVFFLMKKRGR